MKAAGSRLSRRGWLQLTGFASAVALSPWPVAAGSPAGDAEAVVAELVADLWVILSAEDLTEAARVDAMVAALERRTDVPLLSRLALGRHWNQLSDGQRSDYQALFGRVVVGSLARQLNGYAGNASGSVDEHFAIASTVPVGKRDLLVRSNVMPRQGAKPVSVDWRLRERDQNLVIIDLVLEGASLLVTQRSEFSAVIERKSVDGLLAELRARVSQTPPAG